VQRALYDRFVDRLAEKAKAMVVGNPSQECVMLGPLIDQKQLEHVRQAVNSARDAGARVAAGGGHEGLFFQATVLADITPENPAFHEEIFGPVAVVTPFDSDDEAVKLANDTDYGLSAAVISKDVGRALALGERLRTGILHINDQTVNEEAINPFGGVGASGNGTSIGGPANWEEFTQWQWLTLKGKAPMYPL